MAIQVQLRRGTATENNAFTGAIGELSFDTTANQVRIHDGSTAGGFKIGVGNFPTGTNNVALGNTPLDSLDSSSPGGNNTAVGHDALTATTTGDDLVAVGKDALKANTTANSNVAVGSGALSTSTTATDNTAVGFQALKANDSGVDNVAVGDEAGHDITSGSRNTIVGSKAGDAATTTDDSTLIGYGAGGGAIMTGHDNVAVGSNALAAATSGNSNVVIGKDAGLAISTGNNNVAVGHEALETEDGNGNNVAIGFQALRVQNAGADAHNVAVGYQAGVAITTGTNNVLMGGLSGDALTTGANNIAIGHEALSTEDTTSNNTAIGYQALQDQNGGSENTAVGYRSAANLTSGNRTTVLGHDAALNLNTDDCTMLGHDAGKFATTATNSTFIGSQAGQGVGATPLTGNSNTAIGESSGTNLQGTANGNTFCGAGAGNAVTTGSSHSILGMFSGNDNNLNITTDTNPHIVLSGGDGRPAMFFDEDQGSFGTWYAGNYSSSSYWPISGASNGHNAISQNLSAGQLGITTDSTSAIYINRNNADGYLLLFYSEGSLEGSISVSGTTVSFNGGHLARWSQLSNGLKDASILKGTVMTNLDKMCVWEHAAVAEGDTIKSASGVERTATEDDVADAYTEKNEQLNCMAVSSVEGDPNVAGVFVNWDETDDNNDMNIAMTGDMVIRIAQGVTVARGDLLMSAGDGTAKPQGDDIVRSKTIAKVTSTNVSHTYDDGSFLVPCVLMAC